MEWNKLTSLAELEQADKESFTRSVLIYKHSTRCEVCNTAVARIERKWIDEDARRLKPYYLDLLKHRDVSNAIAEKYGVEHQSPQVLVIRNGKCVFSQSHLGINYADLMAVA